MKISAQEFEQRRDRLMASIGKGNIAIIASAASHSRNNDVEYPFRQDSDFFYLTGFNEPEALAVFMPGRANGEYVLFCREFDATKALWTGNYAGLDGAREQFAADDAFPIEDLDEILPGMLEGCARVFYPMGVDAELDQRVMEWLNLLREKKRSGCQAPMELVALQHTLHEMRLKKSPAEIAIMRQAGKDSARAHVRAMQLCRAGKTEYQIEAELLYAFALKGMRSPAYPSIVAGGENACILHYTDNDCVLRDGDLLLIDAGGELENYAADITRTFPVSGRFSEAQQKLYQLVLDAQYAAIAEIKPGNNWDMPHQAAIRVLCEGLLQLGLISGELEKAISEQLYLKFYMHRTGHWLGMDVHDVGEYKVDGDWRRLEPGMVLTVEPGLYVPADCKQVASRWRGIGIRIEDDVLVTEDGCEVLTGDVPKEIDEIEALMAAAES